MKHKQVRVSEIIDDELNAIVAQRKKSGSLINTRTAVLSEAIRKIHKRECGL